MWEDQTRVNKFFLGRGDTRPYSLVENLKRDFVGRELEMSNYGVGSLSNEAKILRGLKQLNLSPSIFCKLGGFPRTRFEQGLHGEAGRGFSDANAQMYLSFLQKLFNLQVAADELTRDKNGLVKHLPLDWTKTEQINDALVIRNAQEVCLETNDHALDRVAE